MIYGILDKETGEFRYVAARQLALIHLSPGFPPSIQETGGIPVGLLAGATCEEHTATLSKGDRLCLCTDGITEAENEAEQQFGVERLLNALERNRNLKLDDSLFSVMKCVEGYSARGACG